MKRKLFLCALLALGAIGAIYVLFLLSLVPANKSNHFTRRLIPHMVTEQGNIAWTNNPWRIAGDNDSILYLAHKGLLNLVMQVEKVRLDTAIRTIRLAGIDSPHFSSSAWLSIDSDVYYLADGTKGLIYKGENVNGIGTFLDTSMSFFDKAVVFKDNIYFRSIDPVNGFILGRRNVVNRRQILFPNLLEKQIDGFFDKDGIFLKDTHYSHIIYLYHYRNQFLVMDTSMRLLYQGKTIDTVSRVRLNLGRVDQGKDIKMSSPPPMVNQLACTDNGLLFIKSALPADNEDPGVRAQASVLDVYDLRNGDYRYSFYISDSRRKKMQEFSIRGKILSVMYPGQLKEFKLNENYIK